LVLLEVEGVRCRYGSAFRVQTHFFVLKAHGKALDPLLLRFLSPAVACSQSIAAQASFTRGDCLRVFLGGLSRAIARQASPLRSSGAAAPRGPGHRPRLCENDSTAEFVAPTTFAVPHEATCFNVLTAMFLPALPLTCASLAWFHSLGVVASTPSPGQVDDDARARLAPGTLE